MNKKWYWYTLTGVSAITAILIHLPDLVSVSDRAGLPDIYDEIRPLEVISEIIFTFLSILFLFVLNTVVFGFNRPIHVRFTTVIISFIVTIAFSVSLNHLFYHSHLKFDVPAVHSVVHQYLHPVRDFFIAMIVTGSCYIACLVNRQQQVLVENHQLRAENFRNQYEMLKNQINPHVLFNSLNTLRSLIRDAPHKAQEYTSELSKALRYTLQCNETKTATLRDELDFSYTYIYLLKMRYEDNLLFEISVDPRYYDYLLPPTTLQHLLENAVKHNEISARRPLTVRINTTDDGVLAVSNPVQPKLTREPSTGIGLDNLSKRYRLLFHREIELSGDTETFCVRIPLINPKTCESADS